MTLQEKEQGSRRRIGLTTLILVGLILGLIWGLFLGEYGAWVKWIGDVYIGLLQMTVLPFVSVSLVANIARLSVKESRHLGRIAIMIQLVLWGAGLLILIAMSLAFPRFEGGSFFSTSLVEPPKVPNWIELFIPANPFWSLANNMVPAVVLFSLGLGVALIGVPNKALLLDRLDVMVEGLTRLNKFVVRLAPIGIFGVVAHASSTMSLEQFGLLQGYLLVYGTAALLLTLWILPALIASCTPYTHRDVLDASRDTLLTAFVIGNTFVVLPLIIDAVEKLSVKRSKNVDRAAEYFVPLAYPFPDIGRIVGLVFIPFAAWFYGMQITADRYPQLIGVGFLGAFAKPVATIPLLLNLARIPDDIFNLYLAVGVVASRFGDLMKAMHLMAFSILTSAAASGVLRVNWRGLLIRGAVTLGLVFLSVIAIRSFLDISFASSYSKEKLVTSAKPLLPRVRAEIVENGSTNPEPLTANEDVMDRIKRRKRIRVGFEPDKVPFSYFNLDGDLVGLDVDLAHQLARDLGVRIEFVPCTGDVIAALKNDEFDVAMSGYEGTVRRAAELPHISPYMQVSVGLVVKEYRRSQFRTGEPLPYDSDIRVAVVKGSAASEVTQGVPPNVKVVVIPNERTFFESEPPIADALVTSAEAGSAWTLQYPLFAVVRPTGFEASLPLYCLVAQESQLEEFLEGWLALKRRDGTIERLRSYWILGKDPASKKRRWSVIKNVLGWVE